MTTFTFGKTDLFQRYGIAVETRRDTLHPPVRERKIHIPGRDGDYDLGARWYDGRTLELVCFSVLDLSREQIRRLAYDLSGKKPLTLSDEPDKYYLAQLYDPSVITHIGQKGTKYSLKFSCEPFAYGETLRISLACGENPASCPGTARSPMLVVLRNESGEDATNIQLRAVYRRSAYDQKRG